MSDSELPPSEWLAVEQRRLRKAFVPLLLVAVGAPVAGAACLTAPDGQGATSAAAFSSTDGGGDDAATAGDASTFDFDAGPCSPQPAPEPSDSDAGTCAEFKTAACGLPSDYVAIADGCFLSLSQCFNICHRMMRPCHAYGASCVNNQIVTGQPVLIECAICPGNVGRRPDGFDDRAPVLEASTAPLGAFFAGLARLEAAAIDAFDKLRDDLVEHGAPAELVSAAERSRGEEISHARTMTRLAKRHGSVPAKVERTPRRSRRLAEIARENVVEGCVRETFGALVAAWQADRAADPEIAGALREIAQDELRHAALSWAIARWTDSVLDDEARQSIEKARKDAIDDLIQEAARPLHPSLVEVAGLPSEAEQVRMLDALRTTLWAA
jgi:hypothetical protein